MAHIITSDLDTVDYYDPHSKFGLMLNETVPAETSDPLSLLIDLEEMLLDQYGMTLMQAVARGVLTRGH